MPMLLLAVSVRNQHFWRGRWWHSKHVYLQNGYFSCHFPSTAAPCPNWKIHLQRLACKENSAHTTHFAPSPPSIQMQWESWGTLEDKESCGIGGFRGKTILFSLFTLCKWNHLLLVQEPPFLEWGVVVFCSCYNLHASQGSVGIPAQRGMQQGHGNIWDRHPPPCTSRTAFRIPPVCQMRTALSTELRSSPEQTKGSGHLFHQQFICGAHCQLDMVMSAPIDGFQSGLGNFMEEKSINGF